MLARVEFWTHALVAALSKNPRRELSKVAPLFPTHRPVVERKDEGEAAPVAMSIDEMEAFMHSLVDGEDG